MEFLISLLRLLITRLFRVQVYGMEKVDFSNPAILMPNHSSLLDAVFLGLFLPKHVTFVVNTQIARKFSFILKFRPHVTIDPLNPYSIRQMIRFIQQGKTLVIFPEGRITTTGGLMKIYSGLGYLALRTGAMVYPVILDGLERSKMSYLNEKIKTVRFPDVNISICDPFTIQREEKVSMRIQKQRAAEKIQQILQSEWFLCRKKEEVNLFNELLDAARRHGKGSIIAEDLMQAISYKKLLLAIHVLSIPLKKSLLGKSTVGLLLPNSIGHVVALFGLFRLGITPAILNFSQGEKTLRECCETAGIDSILTSRIFVEKGNMHHLIVELATFCNIYYLEDLKANLHWLDKGKGFLANLWGRKTQNQSGELILFTSGSESKPKAVVLTHDNLFANIQQSKCVIDFTSKDKIFNVLPMFHSFGLTAGTLLPLLSGVPVYLYPSPLHYKVIPELCYEKNATMLFGTSTFLGGYARMAHPYDFYSLRYVFAGAEKLKEDVRQLWLDKFGIRVLEGYGATETSPILALNTPLAYKKGSVGRLLPGIQYQIQPVEGIATGGKLLVRGPNIMKGYWIHDQGFVPCESWYDTGDVVEIDDEGFLFIQSRLKRFAKVGGEMVSLQLVEEVASECFDQGSYAAVSISDPRKGERILLFTTSEACRIETLKSYLLQHRYSPLLCPYKVKMIDHFPLLGSGKMDYVTLKQWGEGV